MEKRMNSINDSLKILLSDTYTLYLKTQNYHWHVKGPNFKPFHELFEEQYTELAMAIDLIAERLRMLGEIAPASFKEFEKYRTLSDGNALLNANEMLKEVHSDHLSLISALNKALNQANKDSDEGSASLLSDRIATHEKMAWILASSFS